ncbi:MFS general substrate transporter [Hyaloscypha hepaticicola]|uniref:MFS general substrate transporter n=1 Tax=Hyaloscypha hepaticicola TaxID=2082293 RepID=A0A2J6PI54_9HELO|nr:MFS general substrate transporter [Hyaloscypha hepaticicola]
MSGKEAISSDAVSVSSSTPSISWRGWLWDSTDVSAEERRFLTKLDFTLLTFGTLGMLIKWIDSSNITNAFVSGMKEDLNLYGNQYNYIVVSWTVGYIIGQWIPFLEVGWTVFTFSLAGAQTYEQMLALRFVVGLFEAGYWPALYYILGSWYNKRKLGKPNGILQSAVSIAPIFSGFLQAGIYDSLNGHAGIAGWDGFLSSAVRL